MDKKDQVCATDTLTRTLLVSGVFFFSLGVVGLLFSEMLGDFLGLDKDSVTILSSVLGVVGVFDIAMARVIPALNQKSKK